MNDIDARPRSPAARVTALAALLAMTSAGCSLVFVSPHSGAEQGIERCTESGGAPALDTVVAVSLVTFAITALAIGSNGSDYDPSGLFAVAAGVPALAYAGSAGYGFVTISECTAKNDVYRHRPR